MSGAIFDKRRRDSKGQDDEVTFGLDYVPTVTPDLTPKQSMAAEALDDDIYKDTVEPLDEKKELDLEVGEAREGWDNKAQYMLAVISYAVGLGNVWRFPYLCQENGGGAFLIPYVIMMFLEGMPLFLIEMGIGQKMRVGPIGVWNTIHPYLGGVGVSQAVISFLVGLYYNVIITWCLFYLAHCFTDPLPWAVCPNATSLNGTILDYPNEECSNVNSSETTFFWYRTAVDTTDSMEDFGGLNWRMFLCLTAAWFIVWACVCKGIKTSGKVMYVTATFPYLVTTVFFIRAIMLEGAGKGVAYMFTPQLERLKDPRVWLDAAAQIFYSMGLAFGGLIAFSSYNPIKNNCKKDVIVLSGANLFTSLYTAITIFSILGFKGQNNYYKCLQQYFVNHESSPNPLITKEAFKLIADANFNETQYSFMHEEVARNACDFSEILRKAGEGTGLAFITFAEVIVEFPGSQFWAVMFFLMLLMLGLGSMFGTLEGVITSLNDMNLFPWLSKIKLTAILCGFSFCVGTIFVTRAGEYWVKLFDVFAGSYALLAVAFFECIAVVYVYGWKRFLNDIEYMTGSRPGLYWHFMWRFIAPIIMVTLFVSSIAFSLTEAPTYPAYNSITATTEKLEYPDWALIVAGIIVVSALIPVPFVAFVRYFKIGRLEHNIPEMERNLNTTQSTMQMLRSMGSFRQMLSLSSINRSSNTLNNRATMLPVEEVTYTLDDQRRIDDVLRVGKSLVGYKDP